MVHYRTGISSHYHVLIYFALFHDKPAAQLPAETKVIWENQQIVLIHHNKKTIQQVSNSLKSKVRLYYLNLHTERPIKESQRQAIDDVGSHIDILELNFQKFSRLLKDIREFGIAEVDEFFRRKIVREQNFVAFILKESDNNSLERAMKGERTERSFTRTMRKSYIVKNDDMVLEFEDSQIVHLQMLGVFSSIDLRYNDLKLVGRGDRLYVTGSQQECLDFKQFAQKTIRNSSMMVLDVEEENRRVDTTRMNMNLPSWTGAKVFTAADVLTICQELQDKHQLNGPLQYLNKLMKSKKEFLIVCCDSQHTTTTEKLVRKELAMADSSGNVLSFSVASKDAAESFRQSGRPRRSHAQIDSMYLDDLSISQIAVSKNQSVRFEEPSTKRRYRQRQTKEQERQTESRLRRTETEVSIRREISSRTIKQADYDENDMKVWFSKNDHIDPGNLLIRQEGDAVTVVLLGSRQDRENHKLVGSFEMYFKYNKVIFLKDEEVEIAKNEMNVLKEQNNYNLQYIEGFGPYRPSEMYKPSNLKRQLNLINKNNIKEGGQNRHPFYCVLFVGVHSVGDVVEKRIRDAIKEEAREAERVQEWSFELQPDVAKSMSTQNLKELILKKIQQELDESRCLKLSSEKWTKDGLNIKITPSSGASRQVLDMVKKNLKSLLEKKLSSKLLEVDARISDLENYPELDRGKYIFVSRKQGVFLIGFDAENQIHRVNSVVRSKQVEESIRTEIYFEPMLRKTIDRLRESNGRLAIGIKSSGHQIVIELKGFAHLVAEAMDTIKDHIQVFQYQIKTFQMDVSREDTRVIKEHGLLEHLQKEFAIKAGLAFNTAKSIELTLPKGTITFHCKSFGKLAESNEILIVFNEREMAEHSSKKIPPGDDAFYLYDQQSRTCLVKGVKSLMRLNFAKGTKLQMYPPEGQSVKQFACEMLEALKIYQGENHFYIYVFTRKDYDSSDQYEELASQIKKGVLDAKTKQDVVIWSWEQKGVRTPYPAAAQAKLNKAVTNKQTKEELNESDLKLSKPTHFYNKANSVLTHSITKALTKVDKLSPLLYRFSGEFGIMDIPASQIAIIESSTGDDVPIVLVLYKIDLNSMVQTNLYTGFQRKVVKEVESVLKPTNLLQNAKIKTFQIKQPTVEVTYHHTLNDEIERRLNQSLKLSLSNYRVARETMEVDSKQMSQYDLKVLCEENGVEMVTLRRNGDILIVELKGYNSKDIDIIKHKYEIKKLKLVKASSEIDYPSTWTNGKEDTMLYEVPLNTAEYKKISSEFKIKPIKRLLRVENKLIWKKYSQEKKALEYITGETIRQMSLFHGTRDHDPKGIYEYKQEAFNINYSGERNYFGRGIYFAQEASYSKKYAHPNNSAPLRTILYCRVLVGTSQQMADSDRNTDIKDTQIRDTAKCIKYESIHSNYDGSDIYIVYKSRRAYPEYVIEF